MDFLSPEEKQLMVDDFSDLVEDEETGVEITYKTFVSAGTFDPATGQKTPVFTSKTFTAYRMSVSQEEVAIGGTQGPYELGDKRYLIAVTDVTLPSKNDRIVDDEGEWFVQSFSTTSPAVFHDIVARKP